ncbi:claudin-10 isoform X1 [Austrofundulus limnaeus]|uniref:Claudin-10 isoform X1 n=1 Tax=Austrofundulus limnaeus TaxID=52670 RepID=A0A2I4CFH4_AUSLI|nr:PREDICTED: claudin-10-like isoform X1 [Austrofundulus limnaeus]
MKKRLIQIFGFLISSLGWLFVLCTMAMNYWRTSQIGGKGGSSVIKVAWYWSNLWKDCYTDSTAVTNCRDYGVLWNVLYYVQAVRGLLICGLTIGFFAVTCCFIGMECTYIGGAEQTKDKLVVSGAVFHFIGGVSNLAAYCLYINRVVKTAFVRNPAPGTLRYDLGPPIFLGLVGCFLIMFGAVLYAVTVFRVVYPESGSGLQRKDIHAHYVQKQKPLHQILRSLQTLWNLYRIGTIKRQHLKALSGDNKSVGKRCICVASNLLCT